MIVIKYIRSLKKLALASLLFVTAACTGDFEEINTDPNGAEQIPTPYLLTSAQQKLISINSGLGFNKTLMMYSQLWAQRETTNRSRYDLTPDGDWSSFYTSGLPDLQSIIDLNSGDNKADYAAYGNNENQIAVARIMKAWAFSLITDTWGDVPYTQALNSDVVFPEYDMQSEIYPSLINELKDAAAQVNTGASGFTQGDLMYDGDMTKWKKFANSLRARLALRMINANQSLAESELQDALSSEVFTSLDDQALIYFQAEDANANPLYIEYLSQRWTLPSQLIINTLKDLDDPRLMVYAEPNASSGEYIGIPYGLEDGVSTGQWPEEDISIQGSRIRQSSFPSILMGYSELLFIRAETAQRGIVSGNASMLYNDAIEANMEFWEIDQGEIDNYLAQPEVSYNATDWQADIGLQRWLSFYMQGPQAFFSWRRLGEPNLTIPTEAPLFNNVTEMPRRYFYPAEEGQLNGENLQDAQSRYSEGDILTARMWLDQ